MNRLMLLALKTSYVLGVSYCLYQCHINAWIQWVRNDVETLCVQIQLCKKYPSLPTATDDVYYNGRDVSLSDATELLDERQQRLHLLLYYSPGHRLFAYMNGVALE